MSRTYRKAERWFYKIRGEFVTHYNDKTVQGKASRYRNINWCDDDYRCGGGFCQIVKVADVENFRCIPKGVKPLHHRIDRARYRNALYHNEDAVIVSSFDPWMYD